MTNDQKDRLNLVIGERLKIARKEAGLSQKELSDRLGFKDRQILSNIESGLRKIAAEELLNIMKILGKSLDFFTDPFLVLGDRVFSWRADRESTLIDDYENKARNIVGAYRNFCDLLGESPSPIVPTLTLTTKSSYEEAQEAGERIARDLDLGSTPADKLASIIEGKLGIIILHVDAPEGISGAACHLQDARFIFINRNEPAARRNYNLAHELFHNLTWVEMPPEKIEVGIFNPKRAPRVEQLAENFSAALLMPKSSLETFWKEAQDADMTDRINRTAKRLKVSSVALYWRLRNLGWLREADVLQVQESRLKWTDGESKPQLYSKIFVEKLCAVLDKGRVSVRKAAELLDCAVDDLAGLIRSYGMQPPFEI